MIRGIRATERHFTDYGCLQTYRLFSFAGRLTSLLN